MNSATKKYRSQVFRALRCSRKTKKILLARLDTFLNTFSEEELDPSYTAILQAFGSPSEMAKTLSSELPAKEFKLWRHNRVLKICCGFVASVAIVSLFAYAIAIHFTYSPTTVIEETYIYEEST